MFVLIGEAYRMIETEQNPLLKEARKMAASSYERSESHSTFKSRRPDNKSEKDFYEAKVDQ
jgi:hypothetical protein